MDWARRRVNIRGAVSVSGSIAGNCEIHDGGILAQIFFNGRLALTVGFEMAHPDFIMRLHSTRLCLVSSWDFAGASFAF